MSDTVLEMSRLFDASPEQVFDAWLEKSWGDWVGPPGVKGEVTQLQPKVGGRYQIVMHREGGDLTVGGIYKEIVRPTRLVMSWKWGQEETDTLITLTFRAIDKGTEMHMRHEGFSAKDRRDGHSVGWNGTFDKLEAWLKQAAPVS
jgi:uncharacterized protein YndB with AHSA1/START domain